MGSLALAGLGVVIAWRLVWPAVALSAAEYALRRHDPAAARAQLDRYLARWPNAGPALLLAAQAARVSDDYGDAERFITALERNSGPTAASQREWQLIGAQQGDFGGEEGRLLSDANRDQADAPAILLALAKGYHASYRSQEAMASANRLIERSPGHVQAFLLRGMIWNSLRRTDEATQDYRRAVELAPENADAHFALAGQLNQIGYTREAIQHYELARRSRPGCQSALLGLARAFTDAAELANAEHWLDELLRSDSGSVPGLVERGHLALRLGRFAEGERFLEQAVRVAPWHRRAHELYLVALKELGRIELAARCEARLAEIRMEDGIGGRLKLRARDARGNVDLRLELWQWSQRNGQVEEALAWLFEVLRIVPGHAQAHAALADYFERAGQPRRAALHRAAAASS